MSKIQQTPQQRANTEYALFNWWPTVSPARVYTGLADWTTPCGTIACFGGHLVHNSHFQAMGVIRGRRGSPELRGRSELTASQVAEHLFGDECIFYSRGQHIADRNTTLNDHEVVTARLRWLLANSEVVL